MNRKNSVLLILLVFTFYSAAFAVDPDYSDYDWEKDRKVFKLSETENSQTEIILKEKKSVEFAYNDKGELVEYILFHKIIRVNSDKAIQENNRIYTQSGGQREFIKHKVRVISPSGKVSILSESDIKEAVDEESKMKYKFFALEGLELGSEIEYFYYLKTYPVYTGVREVFQDDIIKKDVEFEIISPVNLIFKVKSYNGLPEMVIDTTREDKNVLALKITTLPALDKENSSAYKPSLQQLVYKLDRNTATNAKDIISYGPVAENIYKSICAPADKATVKKVKKLVSSIDTKYARDEEDKIRMIEHHLKTNFVTIKNNARELSTLTYVLDNKVGNDDGMIKLFAAVFNYLEIDYQVVLTSDRSLAKFDPEFESYNFLTDYLIYFPSLDKYLSPSDQVSCLGFAPYNLSANYGLFIKKIKLNSFETGVGQIKFIDPVPFDKNFSNHHVKVIFSETDITKPELDLKNEMGGYYAQYYQPYYSLLSEDDRKKVTESIMTGYIETAEVKSVTVENEGRDYFGVRPFIVKAKLTYDGLVEKAGNKYLFKVGELIGPQVEMYQKEARKLEVENTYNRAYNRTITFELPKGYKISNPEDLNMDVFFEEDGERIICFTSKVKQEGNKYTVEVEEYYKKLIFPVSQYENYRKVINAAADFNKITLFIEKI